ncbi:MAG: glycosyltransferase [Candidatus Dadabacteria bacterium]|nr:glycosyltransferase [Candidatus Dadabacteria bacterium]
MNKNDLKNHFISVIIPVYNDSRNLSNCLEALGKQTLSKSMYEIVVVDNGSSQDISEVVRAYPGINFCHEYIEGSYSARNKGILNSRGDIIAFTDSDCIPKDTWLEKGLSAVVSKDSLGFIGGRVNYFARDENNMTSAELWEILNQYDQEECINIMNFGLTANLFTRRFVMDDVGLFNSDLKSAGDYEWGNRVYEKGLNIYYENEVVVSHPARRTLSELSRKVRRLVGGRFDTRSINKDEVVKQVNILKPFAALFDFLKNKKSSSFNYVNYLLKFIFIYLFVKTTAAYELLRLMLGGDPKR